MVIIFPQKLFRDHSAPRVDPFFQKIHIHGKCLPDEADLRLRHISYILQDLMEGVAVDHRDLFLLLPAFRLFCRLLFPENVFPVLTDPYDMGMAVPDLHRAGLCGCLYGSVNGNAGVHLAHPGFHPAFFHQTGRLLIILRRNVRQGFQAFLRLCRHRSKGRGVEVAVTAGIGNAAGKGILIHSRIQRHLDGLYLLRLLQMFSCRGHRESDSSGLGHPKGRLHILPDEFCQFLHIGHLHIPSFTAFHYNRPAAMEPVFYRNPSGNYFIDF